MKFVICRAADSKESKPLCDGAVLEYDASWRTYDKPVWSIEANSLEDILKLADIVPDGIIISKNCGSSLKESVSNYEIMIYDGYIE